MAEVKVGQIRKPTKEFKDDPLGNTKIVISKIEDDCWCSIIFEDGGVTENSPDFIIEKKTELIAEYPTWQEAVNSKEFKGEDKR